ncbi:MAG: hypothetical protein LBF15_06105 [Candidatus Peribacteria bacterium]|jgi:hypothetical protein|nr:hypothetical protein [Candidatus Peribacteria bacterium]
MRAPEVCALLKPPKTYLNLDEEIIEEFANNLIRVLVQKKEPEKAPESPKFIFERSNPFFVFEIKSVRKSPI